MLSSMTYCIKQGFKNICRNVKFSLASIATISACIFLFCLFFSIIINLNYIVTNAESSIGISVFFDEDLSESEIQSIGSTISERPEIKHMEYISASDAWDEFKQEYFGDRAELAEAFADDNPLAGSSSYTIFLNDIEKQEEFVKYVESLDGVRQVNYSNTAIAGLQRLNRIISLLSVAIIGILALVAIFLISNTISVAAAFRRKENEIMKLMGATNAMIRAPFVVEGMLLGIIGAAIPLAAVYFLYSYVAGYISSRLGILSGLFTFIPVYNIYPYMVAISATMAVGLGIVVSFFTIRRHLRV